MSYYQVNTWDDFVTAYRAAIPAGETKTIDIMTDIDCKSSLTGMLAAANGVTVVNGNYHNITNISNQSTVNSILIRTGGSGRVTFNKCNFINCYRTENYNFFQGYDSSTPMYFNDCTIQGQGYSLSRHCIYNRCSISWIVKMPLSSYLIGDGSLTNCWLHVDLNRSTNSNAICSAMTNCYIEGTITSTAGATSAYRVSTLANNSVINIDTELDFNNLSGSAPSILSVYNTTKMTGTIPSQTNLIGVTDTQLKDAAYLASIGFNIIV